MPPTALHSLADPHTYNLEERLATSTIIVMLAGGSLAPKSAAFSHRTAPYERRFGVHPLGQEEEQAIQEFLVVNAECILKAYR